ncbi:hypothetical protein KY362_07770 [Candidatus Woesearchaeota archaeon]|nr:hypothetical protein [Candidatus Woesearchaeota archaeon]
MEKKKEISKTLAFALVVLTVLISAASTWIIIDKTLDSPGPHPTLSETLVRLHILRGPVVEPAQTDSNAGQVQLYISDKGG